MNRTLRIELGCLVLAAVFLFCGCSHLGKKTNETSAFGQVDTKDQTPTASYEDFGDILIPNELKLDSKASFVLRASGLTAGVLVFKGRVEQSSLIHFFEANMAKDNWQLVSSFKSPRTLMLYRKDTRWCVINVFESNFSMNVEIWVSPTIDDPSSGLLK